MNIYKQLIRRILFLFPPEKAHAITFFGLKIFRIIPFVGVYVKKLNASSYPNIRKTVFGIEFPNPVGLAAGLDKDSEVFEMLGNLGFGFVEIGTVTPLPQPGNPAPRLFRVIKDSALINRMGFNNKGAEYSYKKLSKRKSKIIIGGNIGKNKLTPNESAFNDYEICFEKLFPVVDYFTINVSSPNTPNLRELQEKEPLKNLLAGLQKLNSQKKQRKPILLKIAPDLSFEQIDDIIKIVGETKIDGLVATNTTISRENLTTSQIEIDKFGNGGLSGKPLKNRATEIIRYISEKTNKQLPIIGAGGIMSAEDAMEKLEAGADLIQLYTGFIYEGAELIKKINKRISETELKNQNKIQDSL
jgi:dihydroorotate dehydrogenase